MRIVNRSAALVALTVVQTLSDAPVTDLLSLLRAQPSGNLSDDQVKGSVAGYANFDVVEIVLSAPSLQKQCRIGIVI
jgi:hypothetical protein